MGSIWNRLKSFKYHLMTMKSLITFGSLLRSFRNKCNDPLTGRRLSQERLGALIGEAVGTRYSAQAVSDWERDRSQINKDHRQVLIALVQILRDFGGIRSVDEAERFLAAGNYRGLDREELHQIFGMEKTEKAAEIRKRYWHMKFDSFYNWKNNLTLISGLKMIVWVICWATTYLGFGPVLDFSLRGKTNLVTTAVIWSLTLWILPFVVVWCAPTKLNTPDGRQTSSTSYFSQAVGTSLGFSLGATNVLTLALISYNLYLYPWPKLITFLFCLWPVVLGGSGGNLVNLHPSLENRRRTLHTELIFFLILLIPPLLGVGLYFLHPLLLSRVLGPLLLIVVMSGLNGVFYAISCPSP